MAFTHHLSLIRRLTRREFDQRFKGSFLGWFWAIIVPLAMLAVYSLVFGSILGSRWPQPEDATTQFPFPMLLFVGLIVFGLFSEPFNRAPSLILENSSYVKKVVFPLEILPVVAVIGALINSGISFIAFFLIYFGLFGIPPYTALLLPISLLPLVLFTLGVSYFLSSVGVFLRDVRHITAPLSTAMLFLSAIFYDPESVPEAYRWLLYLNPLTPAALQARDLLFWGKIPSLFEFAVSLLFSLLVFSLGLEWFKRTKKAFSDVI
ncbi:ABC transporter permease [Limoniibacter endophyticus]|uniref:Transport permease protein n=1 Tax=Limoniibacter endophyticus TaxID=1565040 RepID=A0A8J3GFQ0_9HYPH|nr:ABC transporter permease [Limoniibacter endophyticus]GHC68130.1 transport permease protein [Limoniibacter endophyticus]